MAKRAVALLLIFSIILCLFSCDNTKSASTPSPAQQETPTYTPLPTATPVATPPYKTMNVGSSKTLQGTCLFINIFLSDRESSFTEAEKEACQNNMKIAIDYLIEQANTYDVTFKPIYNYPDTILDYEVDFNIPINSQTDMNPNWLKPVLDSIFNEYSLDSVLEKYQADNVSYIYHINKTGNSYALQQVFNYTNPVVSEIAVLYNLYKHLLGTSVESPAVYAHEILHLFGAIDSPPYVYGDPCTELAHTDFRYDIMFSSSFGIEETGIYALTAYLIGWAEELEEKYQIFLE